MELYVLSKQDLSILSICKLADWQINLDEETNAKSTFVLKKTEGLIKDNFIVLNGLYKQFLFVIDEVQTEKSSNLCTVTALDISNIFDRKVIEKNIEDMKEKSIEEFLANTISDNFVNSDDTYLNVGYIDIYWHTNTKGVVATNSENGLYNFHTFLINCRQYKNIYTDFQFINRRLRIDIQYKEETTKLIDTTLPEVTDYNKIYENDVTAKVTVFIRENGSEYNLYLKTDRTTTTNKDDPDRASGKIEVISVDTADLAAEEALNVMKGNNYKHLVEFKIAKTSKTMDISEFTIGRPVRIKTEDDIYDSYISAITMSDENFVYFKSGSLRNTLIDKLKSNENKVGNKLDVSGGKITGSLQVNGAIYSKDLATNNFVNVLFEYLEESYNIDNIKENGTFGVFNATGTLPTGYSASDNNFIVECFMWASDYGRQILHDVRSNKIYIRNLFNNVWQPWGSIPPKTEAGVVYYHEMEATAEQFVGAKRIKYITFKNTYSSPPTVIISTLNNRIDTYGGLIMSVGGVTNTGCFINVGENYNDSAIGVMYMVIGN